MSDDKKAYDSTEDTKKHINQVKSLLHEFCRELIRRGQNHDKTKLGSPEKEIFDEFTPKLEHTTYGSKEYKTFLEEMQVALDHHYEHNDHHPEHWENGIEDMDLMSITEMLADWKAATMRHADGDLLTSIEKNQERFGYGDEFKSILKNTSIRYFGEEEK